MSQDENPNKTTYDQSEIESNCVFCKIVRGDIPAVKIYEDEDTLAFMDIKPNHRGHTLVVPKEHFENIHSLPAESVCRVFMVAQKIATASRNALDADGINIVMNNDSAAGQEIWHSHVHVIPRYNNDGGYIGQKYTYIAGEMEEVAEKIKAEL